MQNVNDPRWDGNRLHNLHTREGVAADGDCPVCAGFVKPYIGTEDLVSKNRRRIFTGQQPQQQPAGKVPGNPPDPGPGKRDTFSREENVTDAEAIAAFQMVQTVQNLGFTSRAFDVLHSWLINKQGDANLAWGLNWDGTPIKRKEPPPCPDWKHCSKSKEHWGDCAPYTPYVWSAPAPAAPVTPERTVSRMANGGVMINGTPHSPSCDCAIGCAAFRASEAAARHAARTNGVTDHHPNAYSTTEERIDHVTADEVGLYTKYYEVVGSESCGHVWVTRLVDHVWCHSCNKRPVNYKFTQIPMPMMDPRVTAYRTALAAEKARVTLEVSE